MTEEANFDKTYPESVRYTFSMSFSFGLKPGGEAQLSFSFEKFPNTIICYRKHCYFGGAMAPALLVDTMILLDIS